MSALLDRPIATEPIPLEKRAAKLVAAAGLLYVRSPHWIEFFRAILGVDGEAARYFPVAEERQAFEQTAQYAAIQDMLAKLRTKKPQYDRVAPTRVITVRLPADLHASLLDEAHDRGTSMNQLCIRKLLQAIDAGTL